jgi:hypothetical protein
MKPPPSSLWVVPLLAGALAAAQPPRTTLCPDVLGVYPVDFKIDNPLQQRPRFEIRACGHGSDEIQLLGFEANAENPVLIEGGSHIELLIHTGTVLIIQMTAGSSDPTLAAQFQKGTPVLLGREDGQGGITYKEERKKDGVYAMIAIPQKTYPNSHGKFPKVPPRRYRLRIDED